MGTKYLARSADVLSEADRFQDIMEWELFTFAQEQLLWGYNEEVSWVPGVPIYEDPRLIYRGSCDCSICIEDYGPVPDYTGHCVRPMFEEFEDGVHPERQRCEPCGVSWNDGDICWMCGKTYTRPTYDVSYGGYVLSYAAADVGFTIRMAGAMDGFRQGMRGLASAVDEWSQLISGTRGALFDPGTIRSLEVGSFQLPWGTEAFFDPTDGDITEISGRARYMSRRWRTAKRDVPLPVMPEPRDFSKKIRNNNGPSNSNPAGEQRQRHRRAGNSGRRANSRSSGNRSR